MKIPNNIKAAIFDGDGVLFDTEPVMFEAFIQAVERYYQRRIVRDDVLEFAGVTDRNIVPILNERWGDEVDWEQFHEYKHRLFYQEVAHNGLTLIPGAQEALDWCRTQQGGGQTDGARWKVALASSAPHKKIQLNIETTGLNFEFDAVVSGEEMERSKPAPDIYLEAARRIGIAPTDCLAVEDSTAGVKSAKGAGMFTIGLTGTFDASALQSAGADFVAESHNIWLHK